LVILIEDLLSISRLDAESTPVNRVPLDLNALSEALVDDRKRLFSDRELDLHWQPEESGVWVYADEKLLSQVIANLMTNAMHYTPAGGRVELRTRVAEQGDWVQLEVSDTGLGIPDSEKDLLFTRFFRGSASRTMATPGTGLGLAICQEIIDRHDGRITVSSRVGEGSRFTVWLAPATPTVESELSTTVSQN
jgi:signal transduction histidine kinase